MRRSLLVRSLVQFRKARTGEPTRQLVRWASELELDLSPAEQTALADAFRFAFRFKVPDPACLSSAPAVPLELRQRVLPAALSHPQQCLEASVLQALTRGMDPLVVHPEAWSYRLGRVVRSVRPRHDSLLLRLDPHVLGPLLAELLPIPPLEGFELSGTAGVRLCWHKTGFLEIVLLGTVPCARVVVADVSERVWRAALVYLREERPWTLRLAATHPDVLSSDEVAVIDEGRRLYVPTDLASGLLRRILLFRDTWSLRIIGKATDEMKVEWCGSPAKEALIVDLCHPAAQITQDAFSVQTWQGSPLAVVEENQATAGTVTNYPTRPTTLWLLNLDDIHPYHSADSSGQVPAFWRAWEAEFHTHTALSGAAS